MKRLFFVVLATTMLFACDVKTRVIEYEGTRSEYALFVDSLFGIVDGKRQLINVESATCMQLDTVMDFDGDGVTDALVTDVQACGGNAIGNAFFFVTYTRDGRFVRTNTFGTSVYDTPVIEPWEGMKSVVITNEKFDAETEEVECTPVRYVLVDTFALRAVEPTSITPMPAISFQEWQKEYELKDTGEAVALSPEDSAKYAGCSIFDDLYSDHCSWYCGGEVKGITASSSTIWSPTGLGIGESLVYTFSGSCPRITTVKVLNGDVQSDYFWQQSARVKLMRMYINDTPYALLSFEDSPTLQCFDVGVVGFHDPSAPDWTLTFEILETYAGLQRGVAIAELYFDGIDVH